MLVRQAAFDQFPSPSSNKSWAEQLLFTTLDLRLPAKSPELQASTPTYAATIISCDEVDDTYTVAYRVNCHIQKYHASILQELFNMALKPHSRDSNHLSTLGECWSRIREFEFKNNVRVPTDIAPLAFSTAVFKS